MQPNLGAGETAREAGVGSRPRVTQRWAGLERFLTWDYAAGTVLFLIALAIVFTVKDYAISNDEPIQQQYAELILSHFGKGVYDPALFRVGHMYLYGELFDMMSTLLAKVLPLDLYLIRHLLSAFIGLGGIAAAGLTARLLAGPRAGFIAILMLATSAAWYGTLFNHTKDIPFAAAMMAATYFILRFSRDLPRPRAIDVIGFGLTMGAALGQRSTGLVLVGYAGLMVLVLAMTQSQDFVGRAALVIRAAVALLPSAAIAYVIMVIAWPWAGERLLNPIYGILDFAHLNEQISTMFAGHVYPMSDVPPWYIPGYIAIHIPLVVFLGAGLALLFALPWSRAEIETRRGIAFLAFTAVFPVLLHVIGHGPAYTGMRHYLFVIPLLAVLAGIGFDYLLAMVERSIVVFGAVAASIVLAVAWNVSDMVRLHPYEYLSFNSLVGGLAGASRNYETDYWVNILPEAVHDLRAYVAKEATSPPGGYAVAFCGANEAFEHIAPLSLHVVPNWKQADFFIAPTEMNCDRAMSGPIIARIERMGTMIGVVKDLRATRRGAVSNATAPAIPSRAAL